jgi:hypothetical protein
MLPAMPNRRAADTFDTAKLAGTLRSASPDPYSINYFRNVKVGTQFACEKAGQLAVQSKETFSK